MTTAVMAENVCALLVLRQLKPGSWHVSRLTPRNPSWHVSGRGWRPGSQVTTIRALSAASALHRVCLAWTSEGYSCEARRTSATTAHVTIRRAGHAG